MPNVEVIRKDSVHPDPSFPGCTSDVGTGTSACPTSSQSEECAIVSVHFEDPKEGVSLTEITHQEKVDLVVTTMNMEGETVIIDTGSIGGYFMYADQAVDDDHVLKLKVASSEERIPLDVVPVGVLPDLSFLERKPPVAPGAPIDTSKRLLVTAVEGPDWTELEADGQYEFSVRSFNRDFHAEEAAAVSWVWKVPGGHIQPCVGAQMTLDSGYPAIHLSWSADFLGKEVIIMAYMHSPTEDVSVRKRIRDTSSVEPESHVEDVLTFLLNSEPMSLLTGIGVSFPAFSGLGASVNKPSTVCTPDEGAIPPGTYYVVDRPTGGRLGFVYDWWADREDWFALFADDGTIDDSTYCNTVRRGEFRLHPKGPRGRSLGCITLESLDDFNKLRDKLKGLTPCAVAGTSLTAYAKIIVT